MRIKKASCLLAIFPHIFLASSCIAMGKPAPYGSGEALGKISDTRLTEISGMVASRHFPGVLWVHNDSGDDSLIYAVTAMGKVIGAVLVTGAKAQDWEDIALGPGPVKGQDYLYLGDIGDNQGRRPFIAVYRIPEPDPGSLDSHTPSPSNRSVAHRLVYPDQPRDAETLLVDPLSGELLIVSKREFFSRVYRAPSPTSTTETVTMELVCLLPWGFATGGDISPDGRQIVIRSPGNAMLWQRKPNTPFKEVLPHLGKNVQLAQEPQGEAICFDHQGRNLYTVSEGKHPVLYRYSVTPASQHETSP
ncbi:hypothetical protein ACFL6U_19350 [Planctomycetota bacterium]